MYTARPDERYDFYSSLMTDLNPINAPSSLLFLLLALSANSVSATPIQPQKRDVLHNTKSLSPKIWIPIVIVIIVLFFVGIMSWTKTSWRKTLGLFSFASSDPVGAPTTGTGGTRELTAEQLAGTINGNGTPASAARPTRRTRRPRRTPSQMSVTDLPEYNKEPGEEELVIFRGRENEDVTMPTAVAMISLDEERDESTLSHDNSHASRYSPMPTSPNDTPLLRDDDAAYGDTSMQSLSPPGENMPRHSVDNSSHETSSLMRVESNINLAEMETAPDPRGEAPAYFEVVDQEAEPELQHSRSNSEAPAPPTNPSEARPAPSNRRSGFRTLLNRMSIVSHPSGHAREDSVNSTFSSNISHGAESSTSHTRPSGHRTTPSGASSMFLALSRKRSTHTLNSTRLNSPSAISLNSISAPLTHTLTRSEFTYPKAGPTAEQLKVISSRDSFARFGVPYGADAIAFAASSSRQDLFPPPPDFDTGTGAESQSPRSGSGVPGPSRLRTASNAAQMNAEAAMTSTSGDQPRQISSDSPESGDAGSGNTADVVPAERPSSISRSGLAPNAVSVPETTQTGGTSPASIPLPPSISSIASASTSSSSAAKPKQTISEFGTLSLAPPAPPSSYHSYSSYSEQSASSMRSESHDASVHSGSYRSYATAAESLAPPGALRSAGTGFSGMDMDSDDDYEDVRSGRSGGTSPSQPPTPKMRNGHVLEMTDATVVPQSQRTEGDSRSLSNATLSTLNHS